MDPEFVNLFSALNTKPPHPLPPPPASMLRAPPLPGPSYPSGHSVPPPFAAQVSPPSRPDVYKMMQSQQQQRQLMQGLLSPSPEPLPPPGGRVSPRPAPDTFDRDVQGMAHYLRTGGSEMELMAHWQRSMPPQQQNYCMALLDAAKRTTLPPSCHRTPSPHATKKHRKRDSERGRSPNPPYPTPHPQLQPVHITKSSSPGITPLAFTPTSVMRNSVASHDKAPSEGAANPPPSSRTSRHKDPPGPLDHLLGSSLMPPSGMPKMPSDVLSVEQVERLHIS